MYGVFGGTPRYHAMVDPERPVAQEVVDLLLRPGAPLENEVEFLLGSQQIREPAPYNAVLRAIAGGATQFGEILNQSGTERGRLSFYLSTLQELGWVARELPFGEKSERRGLYRIADPFLRFWYRFMAPLASERQFADPQTLYAERIAPFLPDYMGRHAFEEICCQWLRRHGRERLGLAIREAGRYWGRDGRTEIDLVAGLSAGRYLFAECKWSQRSFVGTDVYAELRAKVASLPEASWRVDPRYALFSAGGFAPELQTFAADSGGTLSLVGPSDLLPTSVPPPNSKVV
jgi:AAA+ ATPase superfamily predicted ATPase